MPMTCPLYCVIVFCALITALVHFCVEKYDIMDWVRDVIYGKAEFNVSYLTRCLCLSGKTANYCSKSTDREATHQCTADLTCAICLGNCYTVLRYFGRDQVFICKYSKRPGPLSIAK